MARAGWFGGKVLTVELGEGNTLRFCESDSKLVLLDVNWGGATTRTLTAAECEALFGGLPVTRNIAVFRSADGALLHFEGWRGDIQIILAADGVPVTDTPVLGDEAVSEINGVPVTGGYAFTRANSRGNKTIIFYAFFRANGATVYMELAGKEADGEALRAEIGGLVDTLTRNPPDPSSVAE